MTGTVSRIESAGDLRRALELADKLTQERAELLVDLELAVQTIDALDPRGGRLVHPSSSELIDSTLSQLRATLEKAGRLP